MIYVLLLMGISAMATEPNSLTVSPICIDGKINRKLCDTFYKNRNALIEIPGGGLMINPGEYYSESFDASMAQARLRAPLTDGEVRSVEDEFEKIQKAAEETLLHGRKVEDLSREELHLYKRLSTVTLNIIKSEPDLTNHCMSDGNVPEDDMFYLPRKHIIDVCPAAVRTGSDELAAGFAHELGHSIDGCSAFDPLVRVNPINQWKEDYDSVKEIEMTYMKPGVLMGGVTKYDVDKRHEAKGVVTAESQGLTTRQSHPFIKALECLEKTPSFEDRAYKNPELYDSNDERFKSLPQTEKDWYSARKSCDETKNANEDFADLFGREVIATRLNSMNPKPLLHDLQVFSLVSPYVGNACFGSVQSQKDSHSWDSLRVGTWVSQSSIRGAVGCQNVSKDFNPCHLFDDTTEIPSLHSEHSEPPKNEVGK